MMYMPKKLVFGGLLVVLAIVVGCDKKALTRESNRGLVTGTVTLDGKPLPGGNITFVSAKDPIYRAKTMIGSDGAFIMREAPVGEVLVAVDTEPLKVFNPKYYVPISSKYANIDTSGLTATVTKSEGEADGQKLSFDLKSK
jgi:hypothetical protein